MTIQASRPSLCTTTLTIAICAITTGALAADYPNYRITDIGSPNLVGIGVTDPTMDASGGIVGAIGTAVYMWRSDGTPAIRIGNSGTLVFGMNALGQVTGFSEYGTENHAFIWRNDGTDIFDLGTLDSTHPVSIGMAINDLGQVAGFADGADERAFLWRNNGSPMQDLGTLSGSVTRAAAVNNSGQVTGSSTTKGALTPHAFLWKNDGKPMVDLGPFKGKASWGLAINASGQVAGHAWAGRVDNYTYYHAYLWRNDGTPPVDLDKTGAGHDSRGMMITDAGQVVGWAWSVASNAYHAFTWKRDGTAIDLGTLGGTNGIEPWSVNRAGWIVGTSSTNLSNTSYSAFLWLDNGQGMKNLNSLIDPADPLASRVLLSTAFAINDAGDIGATGFDYQTNEAHLYLLRGSKLGLDLSSLAFGRHKVGTSSVARIVTVRNRTDSIVPISSIKIAGTGASQFIYSSDCGSAVAGNGSCTIKVTFRPTSKGAKSATLSVNGGGNGLRVVSLTGTGT